MRKARVLLVDDDRDYAESLATVLELEGYAVNIAFNGSQAIDMFGSSRYDMAFMDVQMPGMNGVESFLEIKQANPASQVVMMTGFGREDLLDQAISSGALGVLSKPLDMDRVRAYLKNAVRLGVVLIADDDPDFVDTLDTLLAGVGYTTMIARDGEEVIEQICKADVQALILDQRLPLMTGLEVYLELKRRGRLVPTIIATAYSREESDSLERLEQLSVDGILTKPFAGDALLSMLDSITDSSRA